MEALNNVDTIHIAPCAPWARHGVVKRYPISRPSGGEKGTHRVSTPRVPTMG